jgi:hypothetical protein
VTTARKPLVLFVPAETALVYDHAGWRIVQRPPQWWLDEQDEQIRQDEQPAGRLRLVPPYEGRWTACRPGRGPCRRRHEHASRRRGAVAR